MIPTELVPMSFARRSVSRRRRRTPCLTRVGREIDRISTDSKIASAGTGSRRSDLVITLSGRQFRHLGVQPFGDFCEFLGAVIK